ncbi:ABC transporter permease [Micromonospora harpali]|uniref:ABC transporter permease n=2 Tax=Micromonospora TaxID=1873 RepID=A0A1C4VHX0_9ACTN|nr:MULTISPECIES: ABC transporter permease [Micromonospora]MBB5825994.1 peptide/nickel transport system permease protein [Micromonospora carbonacea]MDG4820042.1 ABC transporter permease [Micromonospora sp. WMMD956]QLD25579.1 ABC transporter permease [Micromonospora carbonacea]WFE56455.1 ABC transporter permease [Micromonospora sp. WMMD712]SCE83389.1 peptide/nickel transport system permease protein [Micromonospora carbonacea]
MTPGWPLARTVLLKLVRLAAVLFVVSLLCFLSLSLLPGDPAQAILGESASPQAVAALHEQLGLDRPFLERFLGWLGNAVQGDLGRSYATNQTVAQIIAERAPVTIELIVLSQLIAIAAAIPAAVAAAARRGSAVDRGMSLWVFTVLSTPNFVVGFVLIWVFAVQLGLYPANGYVPVSAGIGQHLGSLLLPSLTLAAAPFALYQRVLRADLVETYGQEFMQVARAKGISPLRAAMRHAFRPSLLNLTTSVGVTVGVLIGSDVIVETLFSLPGLGAELAHSVSARDYAEVQGLVLVIAAAFVLINAAVDLIYGLIDPRLRARSKAVTR